MCKQRFHIIGLSDQRPLHLPTEVKDLLAKNKVFSGGKRHHEITAEYLPAHALWIDITVPISAVFEQYQGHPEIVVFASGDPLFFGFANTVKRLVPDAEIVLYPYFNSLQLLAHRMVLPYQDMRMLSLTGRPWDKFDQALIEGEPLIGSLTDRSKTPALIAARMLAYGYDNYRMTVGECLGNRQEERVRTFSLQEATQEEFRFPNCIILERTAIRPRPLGIPEQDFHLLNGRINMITKAPIRLLTLSMLDLRHRHTLWDVGSCTGSISIEAKLQFPQLHITAFEVRPEGEQLLQLNSQRFGTPGIDFIGGDFCETCPDEHPDAVFIGGHGGNLIAMLKKIDRQLAPGGVIVFNSVSQQSQDLFRQGIEQVGRTITQEMHVAIDQHNPILILKAE